ncbi:MAG: DHH family phosphoesterase [Candidatus Hodarchaeota archaeon]
MNELKGKVEKLVSDLKKTKDFLFNNYKKYNSSIHIYTHLDADGLTSGAILGKALYRENIPFQISILRQLERENILKICEVVNKFNNFIIFSDFGSGQYLELMKKLEIDNSLRPFIILDHHLPQNVSNKDDDLLKEIYLKTSPWHINPYFYNIDGSVEVSGAGICYYFAKVLNNDNLDLSAIALIGANGDIQNQGPNNSFIGLNSLILEDARNINLIEVVNDLNFSSIKPLNEAIAFSSVINLPGLTGNPNKTLKFLQRLGIYMENLEGSIRTLNDLDQDEKQKISSAIIEYSSIKLDMEPSEVIKNLIINRYLLKNEIVGTELHDLGEFSNLLNSCGRSYNGSLGIAVAMGDRRNAYKKAQESLINYKKLIVQALSWIQREKKIQEKEHIQYFYGEDVIPENIIGTIASMLIFDKSGIIDINKPIFGYAKRKDEEFYKISGRAHEKVVNKGVNLSETIRKALELSNLDYLGGGHPPAAGTKVPIDKIETFLNNCDKMIEKQLKK